MQPILNAVQKRNTGLPCFGTVTQMGSIKLPVANRPTYVLMYIDIAESTQEFA